MFDNNFSSDILLCESYKMNVSDHHFQLKTDPEFKIRSNTRDNDMERAGRYKYVIVKGVLAAQDRRPKTTV